MAVQALSSFIYDAVQNSWIVATVLVKYILILHLAEFGYKQEYELEKLDEILIKYSRPVVTVIVVLGIAATLTGASIRPNFELISQLAAVSYFGYLFWKF